MRRCRGKGQLKLWATDCMELSDAPAKVNLALHVTGRRSDGYHLIESLVVFAGFGDRIFAEPSETDEFVLTGPEAPSLMGEAADGNLVVRARDALRHAARAAGLHAPAVRLVLEKNLPVASGLGGGSADAAAALKQLCRLWRFRPAPELLSRIALDLGADVPMCLAGRPLIARGIGEALSLVNPGAALDMVIVNPRKGVSTPRVFAALENRDSEPLPPLPQPTDLESLIDWLSRTRNDLEQPARRLEPSIADCLDVLASSGARFVRMSGSGASCFGLYGGAKAAREAKKKIRQARPDWFTAVTQTLTSG